RNSPTATRAGPRKSSRLPCPSRKASPWPPRRWWPWGCWPGAAGANLVPPTRRDVSMAREEQDREDLLREAKTLHQRVSLKWAEHEEPSGIGFRRDGGASFYLTPQRVYQFTSDGRLRRAFVEDLLFKAERGRLVSLRRQREPDRVVLLRHELDDDAQRA